MAHSSREWNLRGIQQRVMLIVLLGILASTTAFGWVAWQALDDWTARVLQDRGVHTGVVATHVETVVQREWQRLQEVASAPWTATDDDAGTRMVEPPAILRAALLRAELMERIYVTDGAGRIRWQEPAKPDMTGQTVPDARRAIAAGRPSASQLEDTPGGPRVYLFVTIQSWTGETIGLVAGEIDPSSSRFPVLLRPHQVPPGGSLDVVDQNGAVLGSTDASRVGLDAAHRAFLVQSIADGRASAGTCRTCHDDRRRAVETVMAFTPTRQPRWGVYLQEPEGASLAHVHALRRTLLWLGPLIFVLGIGYAYGAGQSVLRPIRVLTKAAQRIETGDVDEPIPPLGTDELGRLGQSLERMRAALARSFAEIEEANTTLEHRVLDRTRELQRLYGQLAEREEARSRLLRQVITAQEDERKRLARELHDETSQTISALAMRLETALKQLPAGVDGTPINDARVLAVRTLDELHRLIYDLRPAVLDDLGLWPAIQWYAERMLKSRGVAVRCEFADVDRRLPSLVETALFRAVQEAISNIAKHAEADQALIQGTIRNATLTIEIEDDGKGFDPTTIRRPSDLGHGWGLLGITERVEALGGTVTIDSAPDQGARLVFSVPLPREDAHG
ncbi:MAG: HAMP domain-containing protein [Acidobacteriota bacterium]